MLRNLKITLLVGLPYGEEILGSVRDRSIHPQSMLLILKKKKKVEHPFILEFLSIGSHSRGRNTDSFPRGTFHAHAIVIHKCGVCC